MGEPDTSPLASFGAARATRLLTQSTRVSGARAMAVGRVVLMVPAGYDIHCSILGGTVEHHVHGIETVPGIDSSAPAELVAGVGRAGEAATLRAQGQAPAA